MSHESSGSTVDFLNNYGINPDVIEELHGLNPDTDLAYMLSLLNDQEFDDPLEILRDLGLIED